MRLILLLSLFLKFLFCNDNERTRTLFYSLNPQSIRENLAFYSLFPNDHFGKLSLNRSIELINLHRNTPLSCEILKSWPEVSVTSLIQTIGNKMNSNTLPMKKEDVKFIQTIASDLSHLKIRGHQLQKFEDAPILTDDEIDIARTLFLYQFDNDLEKVEAYEAGLDLMALEILAKIPKDFKVKEALNAMHQLIFFEMGFRFPPQSLMSKEIDTYTFLPSVMDDRFGVCLGVSVLYLCIGQRLGLHFNIYTPPGHIFLQAVLEDETIVNIETTARGIHIPMEHYLGINGLYLPKRTTKESIGMTLMNYAALFWGSKKYQEALDVYQKAEPFMPNDPLLHYFITMNALFCNRSSVAEKAYAIYEKNMIQDVIKQQTLLEDYYNGFTSLEGLKTIFYSVDETRESIIQKQNELIGIIKKYPKFRDGLFHLGITHLQLSNFAKAKLILEEYHKIDATNPTVEYYLAHLCMHRLDYKKAKEHLTQAENLLKAHEKSVKLLRPLKLELLKIICLE